MLVASAGDMFSLLQWLTSGGGAVCSHYLCWLRPLHINFLFFTVFPVLCYCNVTSGLSPVRDLYGVIPRPRTAAGVVVLLL